MSQIVSEIAFLPGEKTPRSREEMIQIYTENIQRFGFDGRTLLYPTESMHLQKLKAYYEVLQEKMQQGESILDIGCGFGSLAEPVLEGIPGCTYQGIDIVSEFIEHARKSNEKLSSCFTLTDVKDVDEEVDWCVLLGVVNSVPDPEVLLDKAWRLSVKGLFVDLNSIEKAAITRYTTFDIPAYKTMFEEKGAREVKLITIWDGCTMLAIQK